MYKNKIKECLNNGLIKHNKSNIYLTDEERKYYIIGGVSTNNRQELIDIINRHLSIGTLGMPSCITQ